MEDRRLRIGILIAKMGRLEEKDLEAFKVVTGKTGHPTEADLFRPGSDEAKAGDKCEHRVFVVVDVRTED